MCVSFQPILTDMECQKIWLFANDYMYQERSRQAERSASCLFALPKTGGEEWITARNMQQWLQKTIRGQDSLRGRQKI